MQMSKKKEVPEQPEANELEKEAAPSEPADEVIDEEDQEPIEEEKSKKKGAKKRAKLSVLQAAVLETIRDRPQRPRAIQTIIRGTGGVDVPRNEIIRSLNELRAKGLVDKVTTKAWQAK